MNLSDIPQATEITLDDSHDSPEWSNFKSQYKEGDEIYFFSSDRISWGYLRGREGYVLIRKNEVVDFVVTSMS